MAVCNERVEIATKDIDCNAWLFLEQYLENRLTDTGIKFSEWRDVIKIRNNSGKIRKGEEMRVYEWYDADYCPEPWEIVSENYEMSTSYENPKISAICSRLNLWP